VGWAPQIRCQGKSAPQNKERKRHKASRQPKGQGGSLDFFKIILILPRFINGSLILTGSDAQ
jgi:hypothetical protein